MSAGSFMPCSQGTTGNAGQSSRIFLKKILPGMLHIIISARVSSNERENFRARLERIEFVILGRFSRAHPANR